MFGALSQKMSDVFRRLSGGFNLTEKKISEASSQIFEALVQADVDLQVARDFIAQVQKRALGTKMMKEVTPAQQFAKIVHDELALILGATPQELAQQQKSGQTATLSTPRLNWAGRPALWLICGLQGSGKTTFCAKLAAFVKEQHRKKILLVACDLKRPMAAQQLDLLAQSINVDLFCSNEETDPISMAQKALSHAVKGGYQIVIVDTAGRMEIDADLMNELTQMRHTLNPSEVFFVASAAMGQSIAGVARAFHDRLNLTGAVLTMLDGDARGGAVLSIKALTSCPIKFEGIGERIEDLQPFNPFSMADRMLGMGDAINLVRRAQIHFSEQESKKLETKLASASFTYEDFQHQMQGIKKMGSVASLIKLIPGMSNVEISDGAFLQMEAIIDSMTLGERKEEQEMTMPRRQRLAKGSGRSLDEVNKLIKNFKQAKQFFKNMPTNLKQMQKMMGGAAWR